MNFGHGNNDNDQDKIARRHDYQLNFVQSIQSDYWKQDIEYEAITEQPNRSNSDMATSKPQSMALIGEKSDLQRDPEMPSLEYLSTGANFPSEIPVLSRKDSFDTISGNVQDLHQLSSGALQSSAQDNFSNAPMSIQGVAISSFQPIIQEPTSPYAPSPNIQFLSPQSHSIQQQNKLPSSSFLQSQHSSRSTLNKPLRWSRSDLETMLGAPSNSMAYNGLDTQQRPTIQQVPSTNDKNKGINDNKSMITNFHCAIAEGSGQKDETSSNISNIHSLLISQPAQRQNILQHSKPTAYTGTFPQKLHHMLLDLEKQPGGSQIASFLPHGNSFIILKPKEFAENVLPRYFRMSKFPSFQRQLNLYGFKRIKNGPEEGAYHHALFIAKRPLLCAMISRKK